MLVLGQNPRSHPSICLFVDDVAIQCTVAKIRSKVERKHTCTFARIQTFPDHLPALLQLYNAPRLKTSAQPPEKPLPHRKEAYPKSS